MPYPARDDYIQFLFQLLDEFDNAQADSPKTPGRPQVHTNRTLIVFFSLMIIKGCTAFKAMSRWLHHHQKEVNSFAFESIPHRSTLSRRFKSLYEVIQQFVAFVGQWSAPLGDCFQSEAVYEDKSLFKAKGPVRHKKDIEANTIPNRLRGVDVDATWSKSDYHGWVFGYGLHLTVTTDGFPLLVDADTASVSEHEVLGRKEEALLDMPSGYVIGDDGYTNFKRTKQWCDDGLLLVTPALRATSERGCNYKAFMQQAPIQNLSQKRKTAIEPVFELVSHLLGTRTKQKPVPLRGKSNVRTFLALGVLGLQMAMLLNTIWGLALRNISHLLTVFL